MQQERLYLQPSLTLSDVAERLHTNKTYVSKMVNQTYKMGFPELLNIPCVSIMRSATSAPIPTLRRKRSPRRAAF